MTMREWERGSGAVELQFRRCLKFVEPAQRACTRKAARRAAVLCMQCPNNQVSSSCPAPDWVEASDTRLGKNAVLTHCPNIPSDAA